MYGMPAMPMQPMQQAMQPAPQTWQPAPQAIQPAVQPPQPQKDLVWQPAQPLPVKARGVAAEPAPARFVLPAPEALGVTSSVAAPTAQVDWNQIQARMARLGVLRYRKDSVPTGGWRVTLLLPTADPMRGQPITAQGETEAAAVLLALEYAEAAARR
jgi:hypothetical protein